MIKLGAVAGLACYNCLVCGGTIACAASPGDVCGPCCKEEITPKILSSADSMLEKRSMAYCLDIDSELATGLAVPSTFRGAVENV